MKITEGWMNHKDGKFTADMSDVEMHAKGGKGIHCPGCKKKLSMNDFTAEKDRENDITLWKHKCRECNAELKIFNESKLTFKQFLLSEAKDAKTAFQIRVASGDWKDLKLHFDDLKDIADRINHPLHGAGKTDLGALTGVVQDYIGVGPDGPGTSWDEMDFDVKSLSDDVLKVTYTFSGVNMRQKQGKYGTPVSKTGVITIMPGNE